MRDAPAKTRLFFGDAEYDFRLSVPLVLELERVTGQGIGGLSKRFFEGLFSHREITETIRLGLIGGGNEPEHAAQLVATYSEILSVTELYGIALPIIEQLIFGPVKDIAKTRKKKA